MKHPIKHFLCLLILVGLLLPCFSACSLMGTFPVDPDAGSGGTDGDVSSPPVVASPIVINELCADNKGSISIGGECYDWIELYNTTDQAVDISGWSLSDDFYTLDLFTFASGTSIPANGYLLVMAVGAENVASWQSIRPAAPFKLSENGEHIYLTDQDGALCDEIDFPAVHQKTYEITYARVNDGSDEWGEADPTPTKTNNGSNRVISASVMTFSHESGFYDKAFSLTITVPNGYTVYYTTDCSDPIYSDTAQRLKTSDPTIEIYDRSTEQDTFSGIKVTDDYMFLPSSPVDKCFVLRAYVVAPNKHESRTITKTYFINYGRKDGYTDIPVLTLTADPDDLYYSDDALFVAEQWGHDSSVNRQEIVADMTFMDENGNYVFGQKVGMRIRGTSTRGQHQKNLNIFARSRYDGNSSFIDPLFDDVTETKSFVLRSDGMDRLTIGQGFLQELASDREISTQDYYPVAVFLDGEYYGIYNLYERFSEDYIESHYGVDSGDAWIVKKGGSPNMMESNCTAAANDYSDLMYYICNVGKITDLSDPEAYKKLTERVDIQSLCDILAVQLYIGNEDFSISQNITAWRSATIDPTNPYADGRWRFVIYDLDFTLECTANDYTYTYTYNPFIQEQPWAGAGFMYWAYSHRAEYPFSTSLLKNSEFKAQLAATFESVAANDFAYERARAEMERCLKRLLPNMENYVGRYHNWYKYSAKTLEQDFYDNILPDSEYLKYRADHLLPYMRSAFGITTTASLPKTTPTEPAWLPSKEQNI